MILIFTVMRTSDLICYYFNSVLLVVFIPEVMFILIITFHFFIQEMEVVIVVLGSGIWNFTLLFKLFAVYGKQHQD